MHKYQEEMKLTHWAFCGNKEQIPSWENMGENGNRSK